MFALVELYSTPDQEILRQSYDTVYSCGLAPGEHLMVIAVDLICSVVAMVPHSPEPGLLAYFLVEKPGLDLLCIIGYEEDDDD